MKRLVSLLIALIMALTSVSALAEGFSVHSGVEFGMTMDEVIRKEKDAGFSNVEVYELEDKDNKYCVNKHSSAGVKVCGQIAGFDGAFIVYHFQENGGMDAAIYTLDFNFSGENQYATIRESLAKKYGDPDPLMSDVWHTYLDMDVYAFPDDQYESFKDTAGVSCTITYTYDDSWLVPQDDGSYIIVSGCNYNLYVKSSYSGTLSSYVTTVGYQRFTEEEVNAALAKAKEKVDTYNSQLENDL